MVLVDKRQSASKAPSEVDSSKADKDAPRSALEVRLQKTKLCLYHLRSVCKHGSSCRFAHGEEEMVKQPDLSKTRMCPDLLAGKCTNPNCQHAHRLDEIKATNFCYKTTQCMWFATGRCRNGNQCHFAHGEQDRQTWLDSNRAFEKASGDRAGKKDKEVQQQKQQLDQQQNLQKQLQQQQKQLQLLQQQQQFQQQQQQMQLIQQELQLQEKQQRQHLQVLQMQQQQKQQQQKQAQDMLEPMFIQPSNSVRPSMDQTPQNSLPLPGLLAMPPATTMGMGYPPSDNAGVPPGLSGPPGIAMTPYMQGVGYDHGQNPYAYNPGLAPIPQHATQHVPDAAELNKVEALSKHIKSLRKQVKKLQGSMTHTMRSDSEQSTLSGAINTVSDSSSNDDFPPTSQGSSGESESRRVGNNVGAGNAYRYQTPAYHFAEDKLVEGQAF